MTTAFENLPGVSLDFQDLGRRVTPVADPLIKKVTLIGFTDKVGVALNDPVTLTGPDDRLDYLYESGEENELTKAIEEAYSGGARSVEVVVSAAARYDDYVYPTGSPGPDSAYTALDTTYGLLLNHPTDIVVPVGVMIDHDGLTAGRSFAYQLANYCFLSTLDNDDTVGVIQTSAPDHAAAPSGTVTLAELSAWVTALTSYDTSTINGVAFPEADGVTDADADGVPDTYAFWATSDGEMPTGTPPADDSSVLFDPASNPIDIGKYISVFSSYSEIRNAIGVKLDPTLGYYHGVSAAAYAGLIAATPVHIGTTNKLIPTLTPSRQMSKSQADLLAKHRFVDLITRAGGFRVTAGNTFAYKISQYYRSDFVYLQVFRVTAAVGQLVRAIAEPFISRPNTAANRQMLLTAIDSILTDFQKETGIFNRMPSPTIESTTSQQILGEVSIAMNLDIAGEIRNIPVLLALVPPENA